MNLKVRLKNKTFWVTIIPVIILLITQVLSLFGVEIDLTNIQDKILDIVGIIFLLLAILGVTNDPTTSGISDSEQAMGYEEPKKN